MPILSDAFNFGVIFSNFSDWWYVYLIGIILFAVVIVITFLRKGKIKLNELSPTQSVVYTAIFTAIATVFNYITFFPVSYIAVSFTVTVCYVAGVMLGARRAFLVGFLGDFIGAILFPAGAYNPLIGLASGLAGFVFGFIFENFKGNYAVKTAIGFLVVLVFCTAFLNTFGLYLVYGLGKKSFYAYLIVRLPWQVIVSATNFVLSLIIFDVLRRVLPKSKFNISIKN